MNSNDPTGLIAGRIVCKADLSAEECLGENNIAGVSEFSSGRIGGMFCDQALLPFISNAAECSAWSSMVWHGVPSRVAQHVLPVVVGVGGISAGSIISGITAILGGIGIGEWIHQAIERNKTDIKQVRDAARKVAREPGCRQPEPDDYDTVNESIKDSKGPDGKVSYNDLLAAWREVLCK